MAKISVPDIASQFASQEALNARFQQIEDAINDDLLFRANVANGEPNEMALTLDMNLNRIINLPVAISSGEPVTLGQAIALINDINAGVTVPYLARVVRDQGRVSLVQLKESRLSAQPRLSVFRPKRSQAVPQVAWLGATQPDATMNVLGGSLTVYHTNANHLIGAEVGR